MYLLPPLVAPLPFPSSVVTVSPPSVIILVAGVVLVRKIAPAPVIIVVVILLHPVPSCCCWWWWRSLESQTLASRRWAGRGVTRVAALAECAEEADLTRVDLCLRLRVLLRPLHLDDEDRVALAVLPSFRVDDDVLDWVVALEDGCSARALPLDAHNLRCTPKKLVLGAYLLLLNLLRDVIVGDCAMARGGVAIFQDGLQDLLQEADSVDGVLPRDGISIRDNAHAVVGIAEHTVDVKHHVSDVMLALGVVGHEKLVRSQVAWGRGEALQWQRCSPP